MTDLWRTTVQDPIAEGTTPTIELTLRDVGVGGAVGLPVPAADMDSIRLTHYVRGTGSIINSRDAQDVLNAGIGTYHATSGLLTLALAAADTVLESATALREVHVALIEYTYNGGAGAGKHEVVYTVANLAQVP